MRAARFFQDDIHRRLSRVESSQDIVDAKFIYHANCIRSYELKFNRSQNLNSDFEKTIDCDNIPFENVGSTEPTLDTSQELKEDKKGYIKNYINKIYPEVRGGKAFFYQTFEMK